MDPHIPLNTDDAEMTQIINPGNKETYVLKENIGFLILTHFEEFFPYKIYWLAFYFCWNIDQWLLGILVGYLSILVSQIFVSKYTGWFWYS